jgi:hypothetical protein
LAKKKNKEVAPEELENVADRAAQETADEAREALNAVEADSKESPSGKGKAKEEKPAWKKASFRDFIDGSILTRDFMRGQLVFIFFLAAIAMVYIWNKYHSERLERQTVTIQNELKELRSEKISIQSELMSMSKQSEVVKLIQEKKLELDQLKDPPIKIVVEDKKNNNPADKK